MAKFPGFYALNALRKYVLQEKKNQAECFSIIHHFSEVKNPAFTLRSTIHIPSNIEIAFVPWKSWICHQTLPFFGYAYGCAVARRVGAQLLDHSRAGTVPLGLYCIHSGQFGMAIPFQVQSQEKRTKYFANAYYCSSLLPVISHFLPNSLTSSSPLCSWHNSCSGSLVLSNTIKKIPTTPTPVPGARTANILNATQLAPYFLLISDATYQRHLP